MKLRWVLFAAATLVLLMGVVVGVALLGSSYGLWINLVLLIGQMFLLLPPVVSSVALAGSPYDLDSPPARVALRRGVTAVAALQAVGAVAFIVCAVAAPALAPALVAVIALSVLLLVAGTIIARRVHRRRAVVPDVLPPWSPWSRAQARRKAVRVAMVFAIASLVGAGSAAGLTAALDDESVPVGLWLVWGFSLGSFAASVACFVTAWPLMRAIRLNVSRDITEQRAITRAVLRGKDEPLSADAEARAATYALLTATVLPLQLAQLVFLFAGILPQQVVNAATGQPGSFTALALATCIGMPVLLIPIVWMSLRQARSARAYAHTHTAGKDGLVTGASPAASVGTDELS